MGLFSGLKKIVSSVGSVAGPIVGMSNPALGTAISGISGLMQGQMTNEASARSAAQANEFTKEMMQNRHQWEVADLRAAGLNPVLSAGAAPSMGSSAKADVINPLDSALNAANSAANLRQVNANIANMRADTDKKNSEDTLNRLLSQKTIEDTKLTKINQSSAAAAARSASSQANLDVVRNKTRAAWYSEQGGKLGRFSTFLDEINPLKFFGK